MEKFKGSNLLKSHVTESKKIRPLDFLISSFFG